MKLAANAYNDVRILFVCRNYRSGFRRPSQLYKGIGNKSLKV